MHRMSGKEKVMAVLMGPVEVRQTFRDWPADMCLAVCLMENGDCQLVVFHQDEAEPFPPRLQEHLNLRSDELCFFPAVPGYANRTLLYSDEQRLMALVSEAPEIVEEASDYSVNYGYALDEGLNPAVFMGIEPTAARPVDDRDDAPEAEEPELQPGEERGEAAFVSRRSSQAAPEDALPASTRADRVRKALLPGFMQRVEQAQPGARFRSARELAMSDEHPVICNILPEDNGWIQVAQNGEGGADIRIGDPDLIYLRDDHSVVAIRLEPPWDMSAALPERIWIRAKSLPPSLRGVFADCVGRAEMTGSGSFLYLNVTSQAVPAGLTRATEVFAAETPVGEAEAEQIAAAGDPQAEAEAAPGEAATAVAVPGPDAAGAPVALHRKRTMRRRLLALTGVAATLVLIQLGLQLGGQGEVETLGSQAPIDWQFFRSSFQASRAG